MDGESPIPSGEGILLDAMLLAMLGLYETIELMEKENGDLYWVENAQFCVAVAGLAFTTPIEYLREDFDYQFSVIQLKKNI